MHRIAVIVAAAAASGCSRRVSLRHVRRRRIRFVVLCPDGRRVCGADTFSPSSDLVAQVPWPDAQRPLRQADSFRPRRDASASAPVCAPGFSLLLAPLAALGGPDAVLPPHADCRCASWSGSRLLPHAILPGPLAGAMAAVLIAVSPPMLLSGGAADERRDDGRVVDGDVRGAAGQKVAARRRVLRYGAACPPELAPARARRRIVRWLDQGKTGTRDRSIRDSACRGDLPSWCFRSGCSCSG